ncbi:sulfotransferase family protein [Microbulbifer hydrolyticus]|uniref:Sulfotransferase n=1 Tax=Microbulbifer hydrolyticus TaxID=48074 RepID=A0A6P1TH83_9GAMM|nr:sulfotransferase [Microbulbifer hydrolyticus]MBB5211834.1 hypothetical protein [Microbulbifer hydrolyticus]QHQ40579.1 hypothetical protein GTQ55_17395 [Microbulbifer hydrolyticus]
MSQLKTQPDNAALASPVFIVGSLRSGSTLLRLLLDHHSQINMFGEFEGAVSQAQGENWPDIKDYWRFVKTDRQTSALKLDIDQSLDYEQLVRDFLTQLHRRNSGKIIGASIHSRVDLLPKLWPSARYIQLMRDPRDVARSCIGMGWAGNVYEGAKVWISLEARRTKLRQRTDPANNLNVYYEQLVSDPIGELKKICAFLNVDFEENMLEIESDTSYGFPSAGYAYQWKTKLTGKEIRWVELRTGEAMVTQGYKPTSTKHKPLSRLERTHILFQNRYYRAMFHIRKWGLSLWAQNIISRKFGSKKWTDHVRLRIGEKNKLYLR